MTNDKEIKRTQIIVNPLKSKQHLRIGVSNPRKEIHSSVELVQSDLDEQTHIYFPSS